MSSRSLVPSTPLRRFVAELEAVIAEPEYRLLPVATELMADLVAADDWLAAEHRQPDATRYQQYLLHRDARSRFTVVSFVWGPGQSTPIHDHGTWGLVGMLSGAETAIRYAFTSGRLEALGPAERLERGDVDVVSPAVGDIHQVSNALADNPSISIHVYGADIGLARRHTYQLDGTAQPFVSGYSNAVPVDPADGPFAAP